MSIYNINIPLLIQGLLPLNKRTEIHTAWLDAVNTGMVYSNGNLNEYIYGVTYSYYSPTATYSIGERVIGGVLYTNQVYECISSTFSSTIGQIVSSTISNAGYSYSVGDIFTVNGGIPVARGVVSTVTNPTGLTVDITSVTSGIITGAIVNTSGTGYQVGTVVKVSGGFSLATLTVTSINVTTGGVLTFTITTGGTGYVVSTNIATTTSSIYKGNVLSYSLSQTGYGYSTGVSVSTTNVVGTGRNFKVDILSIGGTPPPIYTDFWQLINPSFIGMNERELYGDQKLTMEWALNRYFNTTFRQPDGVTSSSVLSDIYITDNSIAGGVFLMAPTYTPSSKMKAVGSTEFMSYTPLITTSPGFTSGGWYTIWFPTAVFSSIPGGSASVNSYVNKYNYHGVPFFINTY